MQLIDEWKDKRMLIFVVVVVVYLLLCMQFLFHCSTISFTGQHPKLTESGKLQAEHLPLFNGAIKIITLFMRRFVHSGKGFDCIHIHIHIHYYPLALHVFGSVMFRNWIDLTSNGNWSDSNIWKSVALCYFFFLYCFYFIFIQHHSICHETMYRWNKTKQQKKKKNYAQQIIIWLDELNKVCLRA